MLEEEVKKGVTVFKTKSITQVPKLASAIYKHFLEKDVLEIQSIGPSAVNQALKGVIKARSRLIQSGVDIIIAPFFRDVIIEGNNESAIVLSVFKR